MDNKKCQQLEPAGIDDSRYPYSDDSLVWVGAAVVAAAGAVVFVAAGAFPTTITTNTSSPKNCPFAVDMRQLPRTVPVVLGAVIGTEMS